MYQQSYFLIRRYRKQINSSSQQMKLQIQISKVVLAKQGCCFVALQCDYEDNTTPSQKFRTQISNITNRPNFNRNIFTFSPVIQSQHLKFGLMTCENSSQNSINNSKLMARASVRVALNRLTNLNPQGHTQIVKFTNKTKQLGEFQCNIRFISAKKNQPLKASKVDKSSKLEYFNPLISRILYGEEQSKDKLKMENNIKELQKQVESLYSNFTYLKEEEQNLQNLYNTLGKDEQQLATQIELNQRINQKIAIKINQKENLQPLRLEIDMLRNSDQGKQLLCEKLQYFEERIRIEDEEYQQLAYKYETIKYQIDKRIKRAEDYTQKLKGKQMQLYQIHKYQQILKRYEDIEYQFNCNQHIIHSLSNTQTSSELTAQQAKLLLSEVNFQLQMEKYKDKKVDEPEKMLKLIQNQTNLLKKNEKQQLSEEEKLVYQIKLTALEDQIANVRNRIRKIIPKEKFQVSIVTKF